MKRARRRRRPGVGHVSTAPRPAVGELKDVLKANNENTNVRLPITVNNLFANGAQLDERRNRKRVLRCAHSISRLRPRTSCTKVFTSFPREPKRFDSIAHALVSEKRPRLLDYPRLSPSFRLEMTVAYEETATAISEHKTFARTMIDSYVDWCDDFPYTRAAANATKKAFTHVVVPALAVSGALSTLRDVKFSKIVDGSLVPVDVEPIAPVVVADFLSPEDHARLKNALTMQPESDLSSFVSSAVYKASVGGNRKASSFSHQDVSDFDAGRSPEERERAKDVLVRPFSSLASLAKLRLHSGVSDLDFVPRTDPSFVSYLMYNEPGDKHDLHRDGNNYHGRRFAAIYMVENSDGRGGKSHAKFAYEKSPGEIVELSVDENTMILFQGDKTLHGVTEALEGDSRVVVSMVLCDVCERRSMAKDIAWQTLVDLVFYGQL